jgi:hypothetical protein
MEGMHSIIASYNPIDSETETIGHTVLKVKRLERTMWLVIRPGAQSVEAGDVGGPYRTWVKGEPEQTPVIRPPVNADPPSLDSRLPAVQDYGEITDATNFTIDGIACRRDSCISIESGKHIVTATFTDDETDASISAEATLDVRPGPAEHLVLDPAQSSIRTREYQKYIALGYDHYGNPVPTDTFRPSLTIDDPGGSCSGTTCTSSRIGTHTVTGIATVPDAKAGTRPIRGTATLKVGVGPPARVELDPATTMITAGAWRRYKVRVYDDHDNPIGDAADKATFSISPDGSCERNACTATRPVEHTVTATLPGGHVSGTAILRVTPPSPASLYLSPFTAAITAGADMAYAVGGFDTLSNDLGDLADRSTLTISPDGSCGGSTCTATKAGLHIVTATLIGTSLRARAFLDVEVRRVADLDLRPPSSTIGSGGTRAYTVEAFDSDGLSLGKVTDKTTLSITPEGSCTRTSCTATRPGRYVVTARIPGTAISGKADLYVEPGRVARLLLDPAGSTIGADGSQTYTVRGSDSHLNDLGDLTPRASFSIAPDGRCIGATCTASRTGDHTVTATVLGRTASEDISTSVTLHVRPGAAEALTLEPASKTVTVGGSQTYAIRGFDADLNDLGDLTSRTSFSIAPEGSCVQATCTATEAGSHIVTATLSSANGGGDISKQARLEVLSPPPVRLVLDPPTASRGVGANQQYIARGVDAAGNDLGEATRTSFAITPDGACTGNVCTAEKPGPHTVTARLISPTADGEISGTATLNVSAVTPVRPVIEPRVSSIAAAESQDYRMRGYDARGNDLGDFTARTTFTIRPDGRCAKSTCVPEKVGEHTVVATILPNAPPGSAISAQLVSEATLHVVQGAGPSLIRIVLTALTWILAAGGVLLFAARRIGAWPGRSPPSGGSASSAQDGEQAVSEQVRSEIGPTAITVRTQPDHGDRPTRGVFVQTRHRRHTICTRDGEQE